jgi:putative transposase
MSRIRRKGKVVPGHPRLSVVRQCTLLGISRSSVYYEPVGESSRNLRLMRLIDEQFLETPWYGSRLMCRHLRRESHAVGRKRIRRLMRKMGLAAIYQKPNTSAPHPEHRIYPYLLKGVATTEPGKVWCTDITYVPMRRGFLYLVVVMDWCSRKVLSWKLSNSLDADFCIEALQEALARFPKPEIFNTDQGCQFTSVEFTETLTKAGVKISMDGRGRWRDNIIVERLWRSLKYECIYLNAYEGGSETRRGIGSWVELYNRRRPHSSLDDRTPYEAYWRLPRKGYRYKAA